MSYLPFRGLSAWFSCSVNPKIIRQWDHYGGTYADETTADYLFSDDAQVQDTRRIYGTQKGIVLFQTSWIVKVLQLQCQVHDVVLGEHLLCPHYLAPFETPDLTTGRQLMNSRMDSRSGTKRGNQNKDMTNCNVDEGITGSKQAQLWSELEKKATQSKMSEVVHVENVSVDEEIRDFDCSRPEFQIKRIH